MTREEATQSSDAFLKARILELLDSEDRCIVTTHLDNDDALHHLYVDEVNRMAANETANDAFYVFEYGYQYYTEADFLLRIHYPNNHFPARYESD